MLDLQKDGSLGARALTQVALQSVYSSFLSEIVRASNEGELSDATSLSSAAATAKTLCLS